MSGWGVKLCAALLIGMLTATGALAAGKTGINKEYHQGVDYEIRGERSTPAPEIREFFSFWCGHCFFMQEPFHAVAEYFADRAEFAMTPVGNLGGEMGAESQRAYAVAELLDLTRDFTEELFVQIHMQNVIPEQHDDFVTLFERMGVPAGKFQQMFDSFAARGRVAEYNRMADALRLEVVPELVVNGRYLIKMDNLKTVGELIDVIEFVLSLK